MRRPHDPRPAFRPRRAGPSGPRSILASEQGQALIFGALTLFMLASFVIFVSETGMVTSTRIQMQNAADECAYSGTLYEANVISSVAYLNDAMAYMYYDGLRYAVDTTVLGVLAQLKQYGAPAHIPPDSLVYNDNDSESPGYTGSPIAQYDRVYARAAEQIPQIERTLGMFARWEWGMALACAELVKMEINRVALKHGVEGLALYPDIDFFPANGTQFDLHILKLMEGDEHVGWRVWTDDPPFYVEAQKLGPFHWLITNSDHITYEIEKLDDITYRVQTPDNDITIKRYSDEHVGLKMITHDAGGTKETYVDAHYLPALGGWAVAMNDGDFNIEYQPFAQGGYSISVTNQATGTTNSAGVRRGPDGHMQQWDGSQWNDVPGQNDSVNVGGVNIPVQIDNTIQLGNNCSFQVPNTLHLGNVTYHIPDVFDMGNIWVTLLQDSCRIDALINIATRSGGRTLRFRIEELSKEMGIYGLLGVNYTVPSSADCKWHANREGTERDRLCRDCQLLDGECTTPSDSETEWTYQYRLGNPYFIREDLRRFAHHAICDRDDFARANNFQYPEWATGWYDIAQGEPHGQDYYQTRPNWGAPANYDSDGDGRNDCVRIYASQTWGLTADNTRSFDPYYRKVKPWNLRDLAGASMGYAPPLRLSEDFFYYAFSVGCWRSRRTGKDAAFAIFRDPEWGIVGMASARAGFLETQSDDPQDQVPHYRFTWPTAEEVQQFVNAGYEDLYEPVWTAHLWPMTDAIRDSHLDVYQPNQTGLSYLIHGLMNAHWYRPQKPEDIGKIREEVDVPLGTMGITVDDPRLNDVVEH